MNQRICAGRIPLISPVKMLQKTGEASAVKGFWMPRERRSVVPLQSIIVPSVVMKEGILPLTVMTPFIRPKIAPIKKVINPARGRLIFISDSLTNTKEQNTRIEPMERSNSPHIINIPTPRAIIPNSGAKAKKTLRLSGLVKAKFGERREKTTIKPAKTSKTFTDL